MNRRNYDPIRCATCTFQSDDEDDFDWLTANEPVCDDCASGRTVPVTDDTVEEYVGRERLADYQHDQQVDDNIRKMDNHR